MLTLDSKVCGMSGWLSPFLLMSSRFKCWLVLHSKIYCIVEEARTTANKQLGVMQRKSLKKKIKHPKR